MVAKSFIVGENMNDEFSTQLKPNTINKKAVKVLGIITFVFVILAIVTILVEYITIHSYKKIDAYIQYIDNEKEISYVYYEYDGTLYENIKIESYDSWKYGHKIVGYVNPDKPTEFVAFLDMMIIPAIISVGAMCSGLFSGIFAIFNYISHDMWAKKKNKWQPRTMKIVDVRLVRNNISYDLMIFTATYDDIKYESLAMRGSYDVWKNRISSRDYYIDVYCSPNKQTLCFFDFESLS